VQLFFFLALGPFKVHIDYDTDSAIQSLQLVFTKSVTLNQGRNQDFAKGGA